MIRKSFFIVCLFLNLFLFSCEDDQEEFDVGSTTQLPPDSLKIQEALTKQINRFQDYVNTSLEALEAANMKQLEELKHRVETLDSVRALNLKQISHSLGTLVSTIYLKLDQLTRRRQTFESLKSAQLKQLTLRTEAVERTKGLNLLQFKQRLEEFEPVLSLKFQKLIHRLKFLEAKNEILLYLMQLRGNFPRNCEEVKEEGYNLSTIYRIKPDSAPNAIEVLCDLEKEGGGWTHILHSFHEAQFGHGFDENKKGFGELSGEFWLGLDNIHHLTRYEDNELLVELVVREGTSVFTHYDRFKMGNEDDDYTVTVSGYNGAAGDSSSSESSTKFSTQKNDLDNWWSEKCALDFGDRWWYRYYMSCLLSRIHLRRCLDSLKEGEDFYNLAFKTSRPNLEEVRMMIRPRIDPNS
ncbi:angiopoietin-1-like [Zophobas morio]|uniref:angiopoietin-1-like n=1 Tax=Zophobas morio TaxID=2755281 RepID=UPI003082D202